MSDFNAVHEAIIAAQHELLKRNAKGTVVIELEPHEWACFKATIPFCFDYKGFENAPPTECTLAGGIVRRAPKAPSRISS